MFKVVELGNINVEGHPLAYISKSLGLKQQILSLYNDMIAILHIVTLPIRQAFQGLNNVSMKYIIEQKITFLS